MKKGFTLVELLAVIVILGLLALIAVPAVTKTIKDYRNNLYNVQLSNIKDAARVWASDDFSRIPEVGEAPITVTLATLKQEGLIEEDIKDPRNKELFDNNSTYVIISNIGGTTKYDVVANTESVSFIMSTMCPGCVFGTSSANIGGTLPSGYSSNYTQYKDYFLGFILEEGSISRGFVCGKESKGYYCIESGSTKYSGNESIIEEFYPECTYDENDGVQCEKTHFVHAKEDGSVSISESSEIDANGCAITALGNASCNLN